MRINDDDDDGDDENLQNTSGSTREQISIFIGFNDHYNRLLD